MSSRSSLLWTPIAGLAVGVAAVAGWNAGLDNSAKEADRDDAYTFFNEIIEVKHLIGRLYVDQPDDKKLREGAIRGMVEALDDPYTIYVPASDQVEFNKNLTGEYVGIGAQVNMSTGWLTIVSPMEDTPAFRSGLMPDDKVLEIDGTSTQGLDVEKCVDMLMGKASTPVKLKVDRSGQVFELTIVREKIKTRSVKGYHRNESDPSQWNYMIDPNSRIAYIRVTQFTPKLAEEVAAALKAVGAEETGGDKKLGGLVLDLRFNPGGLLEEANAIADFFLREGIIVSTKGRVHEERVARAVGPGTLPEFPIAVLVNGDSASASEILAGALKENNRAIVVGERSFGKGSVQSLRMLETGLGSELKITEQAYYLPNGRNITRKDDSPAWGVDPTDGFYVRMKDREILDMIQVRRRLELLSQKNAALPANATASTPANTTGTDATTPAATAPTTAPETSPAQLAAIAAIEATDWNNVDSVLATLKDSQLTAAVRAMQGKINSGEWTKTGEAGPMYDNIELDALADARQYRDRLVREILRADRRIEALETATKDADGARAQARDFWPDATNLTDGTLEVRDKDGKLITTLKITGNNLERWLMDADVEKQSGSSDAGEEAQPKEDAAEFANAGAFFGMDVVAFA